MVMVLCPIIRQAPIGWLGMQDITMNEPEAGMQFSETLDTEVSTIKFTPIAVGQFPFYCDGQLLFFQSHRDKGMQGVIEVVE